MSSESLPSYRKPPGSATPGVASIPAKFREQIRGYLRQRLAEGNSYVKALQVSNEFGVTLQKAGKNMEILERQGDIESWSKRTYRITVDGGAE